MSKRDELIDCLRYRPVATTAAQMREAADLLDRYRTLLQGAAKSLRTLYALVEGECPALLGEDRGGDTQLALDIEDVLDSINNEELT